MVVCSFFNRTVLRLATIALGSAALGWSMPAIASPPQLFYTTLTESGDRDDCRSRAQTAVDRLGLSDNPYPHAYLISAYSDRTMTTISCKSFNSRSFYAIVAMAADADVPRSEIKRIFYGFTEALEDSETALPPEPPSRTAISDDSFRQLLVALDRNWSDELGFLAQPVSSNYFTAAQASQIVKAVRWGDNQVQAGVMLYPRLVDPENWFVVEEAVDSSYYREQLRSRVAGLSRQ